MRQAKVVIAMGLLPLALVGGLVLRAPDGAGSRASPVALSTLSEGLVLAAPPARTPAPAGGAADEDALPAGDGFLCGATSDARRCRSSD